MTSREDERRLNFQDELDGAYRDESLGSHKKEIINSVDNSFITDLSIGIKKGLLNHTPEKLLEIFKSLLESKN
ncbi:hypothetical protein BH10PAT1_BH10PAT1_0250 [soil metagenome]